MAPKRRRAALANAGASPSTGEPTKATFEPISRIPDAVQDIDASQWPPLDPGPGGPASLPAPVPETSTAGLRQDLAAAFDERLRLLARRATWIRGAS